MNKLELLTEAIKALKAAQVAEAKLDFLNLNPESPMFEAANLLRDALTKTVANALNDEYGWVEWFVYENDLGNKALEAGYPNKMKPVRTAKDLLEHIDGTE